MNKIIVLISVILIIFALIFSIKRIFYFDIVSEFSSKYGISRTLIFVVIHEESKFRKNAISNKGAIGLMQIMPDTAKEIARELKIQNFKIDMLFEPTTNIEFGIFYISKLMQKYGDVRLSLSAYNAGMGVVDAWLKSNNKVLYPETKRFVENIIRNYERLKWLFG